jgi:hypothetical protein
VTAWRWVIGDWNVAPARELTLATGRQLAYTLTAPATASFNLPGRADEALTLKRMISDLWVYADQHLVYRGRVVNLTDTVTADAHTVAVETVDYRGLLTRRLLVEGDQLAWSSPNYATIAWGLVAATQAKTDGGLGITQGIWQADSPPNPPVVRHYQAGAEIGKTVDDLAAVAFDYGIDANLKMNLWAPSKALTSGFVADYGGTVVGFTFAAVATSWANVVRVSGDATATVSENVWKQSPEGRFEQQIGYPDVVLQDTLRARSAADSAAWLNRRVSLNMDLRPGVVNSTADLDVGSVITVALVDGRIDYTAQVTVAQLAINLDDTGVSHVRVGVLGS